MTADPLAPQLPAEARARVDIDAQLIAAGWVIQDYGSHNVAAARGVAIREVTLDKGHGRADYLLFVDGRACGVIEAKPAGTTLTEVERQSKKYTTGLPEWVPAWAAPLPFAYEATGVETRFTNGFDPEPRSRPVFWFHRPETLAEWCRRFDAGERPITVTDHNFNNMNFPSGEAWAQVTRVELAHGLGDRANVDLR